MQTYVIFFRGINVGGRNILKMQVLKKCLEDAGLNQVSSYIQSGNIVFTSQKTSLASLDKQIKIAVCENHRL